jgi:transposase
VFRSPAANAFFRKPEQHSKDHQCEPSALGTRRYVVAFFKKLPPCLVGIEAFATSHHWSRELQALGHTVRVIPSAYVKPYVKRQKNDAADL